jgi:geranylgeranyl diphosphate synthase, type II
MKSLHSPSSFAHEHAADPEVLYRHGLPVEARESHLRGVLLDTLATPGSLTRLRLGLLAGEVLGLPAAPTRAFATALEYFHTASLLLDDLPCMDDGAERRGQQCAHHKHGEAATILGALAFINRAYGLLWQALAAVPENLRAAAAAHVQHWLGASGVLDGQSLDLHFATSDRSARAVAHAALGKTVSLLRLALVTPALLAGASAREKLLLERLSVYWGLAYQAADDCSDLAAGTEPRSKTPGRDLARGRPNFAVAAGFEPTAERIDHLLALVRKTWAELVALRSGWHALGPLIIRLNQAAVLAAASLPAEYTSARCA